MQTYYINIDGPLGQLEVRNPFFFADPTHPQNKDAFFDRFFRAYIRNFADELYNEHPANLDVQQATRVVNLLRVYFNRLWAVVHHELATSKHRFRGGNVRKNKRF